MLDNLLTLTPVEAVLLIIAALSLVQFAILRATAQSQLKKGVDPRFPGLMGALSDIPARADPKKR